MASKSQSNNKIFRSFLDNFVTYYILIVMKPNYK